MKHPITIVLTGGGSGGHITPLLSLAQELKKQQPDCQIVYIGHKGDNFDSLKIRSNHLDFITFINGGKFRRYHGESLLSHLLDVKTIALNIRDVWRVIRSIGAANKIIRGHNPDVVFSKGSFVAVPVGIAARLHRIPIVTHDSDAVAGLANRIISRWAEADATGMPAKFYTYPEAKIHYVGVPVSDNIKPVSKEAQKAAKKDLKLNPSDKLLLISGGGNGSREVNNAVISIAGELLSANKNLRIAHIAGEGNKQEVQDGYKNTIKKDQLQRVEVIGFTNEFYKYATAADVVIGRAGATSLAELSLMGKPAIIIPSTFLAGGHQMRNADIIVSNHAAEVIWPPLEPGKVLKITKDLLGSEKRRSELSKNISKLAKPKATKDLAKIILEVALGSESHA